MVIEKLKNEFYRQYGTGPQLIVRSPGRVNIIGEHTDYNEGFVLPAAINKAAYLGISLREDPVIHLTAHDIHETYSVDVKELRPVGNMSWPNYLLGAVAQFKKLGIPLKGFNALLSSDVPIGAGLSSSAAVECTVVVALNELLQTKLDKLTLIKMAQKSEHEFSGVLCGIMDMFASVMGKKEQVIKLDCRSLQYEYVPFELDGIKIVLLNTNVKHSLAASAYNTRRNECAQAVEWIREQEPSVHSLRDVTEAMLDQYVLPKSRLIDKRSRFVVRENNRLLQGCEDLKKGDVEALGKKLFATHDGLSKMYEVSCRELDFLVDAVHQLPGVIGARMMGGGFGGCTINLVKESDIEQMIDTIQPAYETAHRLPLTWYIAEIDEGTSIL